MRHAAIEIVENDGKPFFQKPANENLIFAWRSLEDNKIRAEVVSNKYRLRRFNETKQQLFAVWPTKGRSVPSNRDLEQVFRGVYAADDFIQEMELCDPLN